MRLAAIVDHRGRSATAIETSVFFVDSENAAAGMKYTISRSARATILICSYLVFPRSANNYVTSDNIRTIDNSAKDIVLLNKDVENSFAPIFALLFMNF